MPRHDARRSGQSPYAGPDHPRVIWNIGGDVDDEPIVASGRIFVCQGHRRLSAYAATGTRTWTFEVDDLPWHWSLLETVGNSFAGFDDPLGISPPAVAVSGALYVTGGNRLYALDERGRKTWDVCTGRPSRKSEAVSRDWAYLRLDSSPAVGSDGTVYFGSGEGKLYAIGPDGTTRWVYAADDAIGCDPAIGNDGTVYFTCWDGRLHAVSPDGREMWASRFTEPVARESHDLAAFGGPVVSRDGMVYVGDHWSLCAFRSDGILAWRRDHPPAARRAVSEALPAVADDGTLYVGGNGLCALRRDGSEKWHFKMDMSSTAPAIDIKGTVYVAVGQRLYALRRDGTIKWSLAVPPVESNPAIGPNRTVYVGGAAIGEQSEDLR